LETIVQMALRKEPQRRYASADQFSDDVQRYLDGYPVKARPDTAAYRATKFMARNRAAVAGLTFLFLILVAGIAATEWEAHAANERFADVRELAHSVVFEYHDAIENLPGSTPVRERMVKDALRYLNKLSQSGGGDELQREMAESYIKISRVQGNDYSSNLGDVKGASETADKAVAIAYKLVARQSSTGNRALLAEALKEQADVRYSAGDLEGAAVAYRKSVALFDQVLPQLGRNDLDLQDTAVNAYCHLGELLGGEGTTNLGRPKEAMEPYRKALPIAGLMAAQHPESRIAQKAMYTVQLGIAMLNYAAGHLDEAETANRGALATITRIAEANPDSMTDQVELTVARARLARVLSDNGKAAEAAAMELSAIAVIDMQAKLDPSNVIVVRNQSMSEWQAANALLLSGDAKAALVHAQRAVTLAKSLRERNPNDAVVTADLARRLALLVEVDTALDRPAAALVYGREALRVLAETQGTQQNADLRRAAATVQLAVGQAALKAGDPASALVQFKSAESIAAGELASYVGGLRARVDLGQARVGKAECETRLGRVSDAVNDYRASLTVWEALRAERMLPPRFATMPQQIGSALQRLTKS
jgi:tetratricopeptide (TPR) repeat protein